MRHVRRNMLGMAAAAALAVMLGAAVRPAVGPVGSRGEPARLAAVSAVLSVGITVGDLDRSVEFFTRVLDFEVVGEDERFGAGLERLTGVFGARVRSARLRLGDEEIELWQYLAPEGRPVPVDSRSQDRWFQHIAIVVSDMDAAYARLRRHKVRHASTGPQTLPESIPAAAGIEAFYFKDPDGHALELIRFPEGKGDAKWRGRAGLFLGIDHTAIVVRDTEESLRFYRDRLKMRPVGGSENRGNEQAHLNNVEGAHLRITTLKAEQGPGVELLEYLSPRDGREYPRDARANDLISWHTRVLLRAGDGAEMVRDPDGHLVLMQSER